ncbi:PTS fructose transporter subunit IIC [Oligoflexus tunisiensis]|uniref:PTS fructose transporter subunit IIC n=1 Tax=Oligoflexus tunisiensis TaxID=708132 RepID=UPI000ADE978C|nr:fructose-specific PTS transporter subunit EIIC [Oligoflexus tunisiensis]
MQKARIKENLLQLKQHLLTGVSFAVPIIACGGILIATAIALAPMGPKGPDFSSSPLLQMIMTIGTAAFAVFLPVLAAHIAWSIAQKPGLAPGFVGGYLANDIGAGFLGAIVAGLCAGFVVNRIKTLKIPPAFKPIMPIIVIPILSSLLVGVLMLKVIGVPIAGLMAEVSSWLRTMDQGHAVVLAMILGSMIAFDMGGPINKTAFFFGAAMIKEGNYAIMGAIATAICIPPLGLGLATLLAKKLWTQEQREAGMASLAMGMIGITEGAIPFAAADPLRVIPCIMIGSMIGAVVAMLGGVGDHAPHGGPIVLPVVDNKLFYVVAIAIGSCATALLINLFKRHSFLQKGEHA